MKAIKFNSIEVGDLIQIQFYSPDELVKKLGFDPDNPGMVHTSSDVSQQYWQLLTQGGQVMVTGLCSSEPKDEDEECDECGEYGYECDCDDRAQCLGGSLDGVVFIDPYSKEEFYCYPEIVKDVKLIAKSQKRDFIIRGEASIFKIKCMTEMNIEVFETECLDEDEINDILNDGRGFCGEYEFSFPREEAIKLYENLGIWLNSVKDDPSISPGKK